MEESRTPGADFHPPRLGEFIRAHRAALISEWEEAIRQLPKAEHLSRRRRIDHIPEILDRIAEAADDEGAELAGHLSRAPDEHALERLDEGFDLAEVVREYALLRSIVLRRWEREVVGGAHPEEVVALDLAFDEAITASVARYTGARDRTLRALDRISEAALDVGGDVRVLLRQLIQVMLETTGSVDTAMILLRGPDDRLRVRAVLGLDEAAFADFSLAIGEGFSGVVAAEKRPLELSDVAKNPLIVHPAVRSSGLRTVYAVPMLRGGEVVGVAHMGSRTAWEFSHEDKVLFRTMVARATALVSQAQLAERERAARVEAERSFALLGTLLSAAPVGIAVFDRELRYVQINELLARQNGRSVESHLGRTIHEVLPDEIGSSLEALLRRVLATRQPVVDIELDAAAPSTPEEVRSWLVGLYPVVTPGGELVGVGGVAVDITERKRIERELRQEATFRERFIGILGHDLRNPLSAIVSGTALLLRRGDLPERAMAALRRIDRSAHRMARMIRDVLDFTRSRSDGGIPVAPAACDVAAICREVLDEMRTAHPARRFDLSASGDSTCECDGDRVAQVVSNLVGNAVEHGAADAAIALSVEGLGDGVRLRVHNYGPPIAPERIPGLFVPFRRAGPTSGHARGLGLGLFIVKQIVTAHGGTLDVRSSAAGGTTFTVWMPRRRPAGA